MAKAKIPAAKRLKKQATPRRTSSKSKRYHATIGGPNSPGVVRDFYELAEQKRECRKALAEQEPWCKRHNQAGLEALFDAQRKVDEYFALSATPVVIDAAFDEHYGQTIRITMWRD